MHIIKANDYIGDYICTICREIFKENDNIYMIKHYDEHNQKSEKIDMTRKRKHIFHVACIDQYIDENEKQHPDVDYVHLCPIDRDRIDRLIPVKFYQIDALNIINFSHNYYELLDKYNSKDIINVSIIDRINLNYKDANGKTLLYCVCQRGDLRLLKQLIKLGGDATISDNNRFTPLMASITHNYIDVVKYLLKLPQIIEEINYCDDKGKTAIDYAHDYCRFQCLLEILKVPNIDHQILNQILTEYRKIKETDPKYLNYMTIIKEIKRKIKKHLNIQNPTKAELKKLNILPLPLSPNQSPIKTKPQDHQSIKILDIDIDRNPELLDLVYVPLSKNSKDSQLYLSVNQSELDQLKYYNQIDPDIIYKSFIN